MKPKSAQFSFESNVITPACEESHQNTEQVVEEEVEVEEKEEERGSQSWRKRQSWGEARRPSCRRQVFRNHYKASGVTPASQTEQRERERERGEHEQWRREKRQMRVMEVEKDCWIVSRGEDDGKQLLSSTEVIRHSNSPAWASDEITLNNKKRAV